MAKSLDEFMMALAEVLIASAYRLDTTMSPEQLSAILDDTSTPPSFWEAAYQQRLSAVRIAIAGATRVPGDLLRKLLLDWDSRVRRAAMRNPRAVPELSGWLAEGSDPSRFCGMIRDADAPREILDLLAGCADEGLRIEVAAHPNTGSSTLESLLGADASRIRQAAAKHPNAPLDFVDLLRQAGAGPSLNGDGLPCSTIEPSALARLVAAGRGAARLAAGLSGVDAEVLEQLSRDADEGLRAAAARNPTCSSAMLRRLAAETGADVREAVAMNPSCPPDLVVALLGDEEVDVRQAAALHAGLPPAVPALLVRSGSLPDFQDCVPSAPSASRSDLEHLLALGPYGRYLAARNPAVDSKMLEALACDEASFVRAGVARNPASPRWLLLRLMQDPSWWVRAASAENPGSSVRMLEEIARDPHNLVRMRAAQAPATPEGILAALAADPDRMVRIGVARRSGWANRISPVLQHAMERLASDVDPFVRIELARSTALGPIFAVLVTDENAGVRSRLATNAHAPATVLETLVRDREAFVRAGAASNARLPAAEIERLLRGDDAEEVRAGLAANPGIRPALLEVLTRDASHAICAGLARNPMMAAAALERWAADQHPDLREAVATNAGAPRALLRSLALDPVTMVRCFARRNERLWPALVS